MRWPLTQRLSSESSEGNHRADVVGLAGAAECRHLGDLPVQLGIVADHAPAEVRLDRSRCDHVGRDPAQPSSFAR